MISVLIKCNKATDNKLVSKMRTVNYFCCRKNMPFFCLKSDGSRTLSATPLLNRPSQLLINAQDT